MKRVFNCGKKFTAFSMAEMLVVMLILAIVIISMTPVAVKRVKKDAVNPEHGSFECFYEHSDTPGKYNLRQRMRNDVGKIVSDDKIYENYDVNNPPPTPPNCVFTAPRGAMFFTVNAVGGGSPGSGSVSAFTGLPLGATKYSGTAYGGVNYLNSFNEFRSILLDTSQDNVVSLSGMTYGDINTAGTPVKAINDSGIKLFAFLRSGGGILDNSTGGGYVIKKINTEYCAYDPEEFGGYTHNGSGTWTARECKTKNQWTGKCTEYFAGDCAVVNVYLGTNPASGSSAKLSATVKNGSPIYSNSSGYPTAFAAGSSGCRVNGGGNGCYGSCSPATGTIENYSSSMTCPSSSTYKSRGGGIPSAHYTITSYTSFKYHFSDYCRPNGGMSFVDIHGGNCTPNWSNYTQAVENNWYLYTMGNFVLVRKNSSKGVNFYAQAGNPGDFRTLYVSRFAQGVQITPGAPKPSNNAENSQVGNDTIMKYVDGVQLLRVSGGKRAIAANQSLDNTFIVGNLFKLPPPANPYVIAYDNNKGDNSGSLGEYGNYFLNKDSFFIYPIPDNETAIPSNVGQGGHGSYTIFRSSGNTEGYRVWKLIDSNSSKVTNEFDTSKTYTWVSQILNSVSTAGARVSQDPYTCVSNNKTLSGDEPRPDRPGNSYRCYAGDGQGGAVVITW